MILLTESSLQKFDSLKKTRDKTCTVSAEFLKSHFELYKIGRELNTNLRTFVVLN